MWRAESVVVADASYGSEENYRFMEEAGIEAFVKYNRLHLEPRPIAGGKTQSGYSTESARYRAQDCKGRPVRHPCCPDNTVP